VPLDYDDPDDNGKVYVPGFTSRDALDACENEIVVFPHRLKPHVLEAVNKTLSEA